MEVLIISIIGSLIAGIILAKTVPVFSTLLNNIMLKLFSIVIVRKYSSQKSAQKRMLNDFHNSDTISVFAVRGGTFSDVVHEETPFNNEVKNQNKKARYLISSKDNAHVESRGKELGMKNLGDAVGLSISNFMDLKKENNNISLRLHKEEAKTRIIIFDNVIYVSLYKKEMASRKSPVYRIRKESDLWNIFSLEFEEKWKKYEESENNLVANGT